MWDEIQDMPGEIFDIQEWIDDTEDEPGWDLNGFDDNN
jgi:hypothetical protein